MILQETFVVEDCIKYITGSESFTTTEEHREIATYTAQTSYSVEFKFKSTNNKQFNIGLYPLATISNRIAGGVNSNSVRYLTNDINSQNGTSYTTGDELTVAIEKNNTTTTATMDAISQTTTQSWVSDLSRIMIHSWSSSKTVIYTVKIKPL